MCAKSNKRYLDTSDELKIMPWKSGIKLVSPKKSTKKSTVDQNYLTSVKELMDLPVNVYFLNTKSQVQRINETTAEVFSYLSCEDALDKTAEDVTPKETSSVLLLNDNQVFTEEKMLIKPETGDTKNGNSFDLLTVKMPWYNNDSKIIGLLGLSFKSLQFLQCIFKFTNFKNPSDNFELFAKDNLIQEGNILVPNLKRKSLSKRQLECLFYLAKGKTYKEIAIILQLSSRTVEHYMETIKDKWNCSNKSQLIGKAQAYFNII